MSYFGSHIRSTLRLFSLLLLISTLHSLFIWFNTAALHAQESVATTVSDSLVRDSLGAQVRDSLVKENAVRAAQELGAAEITAIVPQDFGDLLRRFGQFDAAGSGPFGQPKQLILWGVPVREAGEIWNGARLFSALQFPQTGTVDLHALPLEEIESLSVGESGNETKSETVETKGVATPENAPYARARLKRGPKGLSVLSVVFTRQLGRAGNFSFSGGFKKARGKDDPRSYDGKSFNGHYRNRFRNGWSLAGDYHLYDEKRGVVAWEELAFLDLRRKAKAEHLSLTLIRKWHERRRLATELFYSRDRVTLKDNAGRFANGYQQKRPGGTLSWQENLSGSQQITGTSRFFYDFFEQDKTQRLYHVVLKAQDAWKPNNLITLVLSGSAEKQRFQPLQFYGGISMALAPAKRMPEFKVSVGQKGDFPTAFDRFARPDSVAGLNYRESGNANLAVGRTKEIEGSVAWRKSAFAVGTTGTYQWLDKKILWQNRDPNLQYGDWRPNNEDVKTWGFSTFISGTLPRWGSAYLVYGYKNPVIVQTEASLPLAPKHRVYFQVWNAERPIENVLTVQGELDGEFLSSRKDDLYPGNRLPAVLRLDFKARFKIKDLTIYYFFENLTNRPYTLRGITPAVERGHSFGFAWEFFD